MDDFIDAGRRFGRLQGQLLLLLLLLLLQLLLFLLLLLFLMLLLLLVQFQLTLVDDQALVERFHVRFERLLRLCQVVVLAFEPVHPSVCLRAESSFADAVLLAGSLQRLHLGLGLGQLLGERIFLVARFHQFLADILHDRLQLGFGGAQR